MGPWSHAGSILDGYGRSARRPVCEDLRAEEHESAQPQSAEAHKVQRQRGARCEEADRGRGKTDDTDSHLYAGAKQVDEPELKTDERQEEDPPAEDQKLDAPGTKRRILFRRA
jgi:hypothetical protein